MRASVPPPGSAARRAYDFIKWAILSAVYAAGDVITEGGLANELGVSRTPVREALLRLEVEGLVVLEPKKGAVVSTFTLQEAEDVLEARELVENHTAAVVRPPRDAPARLEACTPRCAGDGTSTTPPRSPTPTGASTS